MTGISTKGRMALSCRVNGAEIAQQIPTSRVLSDFLREDLALTGTKPACGRTVCGACTVLIDGVPRAACSTFAFEAEGREVTTIEGLEQGNALDPLQAAFARKSAFQCGFCTAGMILLAKGLLAEHPRPSRAQVTEWISSNICRCTGYALIVEAIMEAADEMAQQEAAE